MLLNDTHNDRQRLACLLAGSVERHTGAGYWTGAMVGVAFTAALLLLLLWLLFHLTEGMPII
jgi:hypothetical protein